MKTFIFRKLDFFALNPKFKKYPTKLGFIFSLLYISLVIVTSIYFLTEIFEKNQPEIQKTEASHFLSSKKTLTNDSIRIRFMDNLGNNIDITNIIQIYLIPFVNDKYNISQIKPLEKCKNPLDYDNVFYCLPEYFEFDVSGYFITFNKSFLVINVDKCNKLYNPNCLPIEEINKKLKSIQIGFVFIHLIEQLYNYKEPVRREYKGEAIFLASELKKFMRVYYKMNEITTDDNIFTKSSKNISYSNIDNIFIDSQINNDGNLLSLTLTMSNNKIYYLRTYKKIVDVLGQIGGISSILFNVFNIIVLPFAEIIYYTNILKTIFKFNSISKDNNKEKKNVQNLKEKGILYSFSKI